MVVFGQTSSAADPTGLFKGAFHQRRSNIGSAEPGSTLIVDLNQVQVMMCSTNVKLGSAELRWLYVLYADWSDLIEITDVTCTVYITLMRKSGRK